MLFDKKFGWVVEDIVVSRGPFFEWFQWRFVFLPIVVGGLDLYLALEACSYTFMASKVPSWVLQDCILRDNEMSGMGSDFGDAMNGLRGAILDFDLSGFTSKNIVPF